MAYNYVQFISYELNTFPGKKEGAFIKMETFNTDAGPRTVPVFHAEKCYMGVSNTTKDIKNRCLLMKQAIEKAAIRSQVSVASGCLKIFMAPEFYFRGTRGAYSLDEYQTIIPKLRAMVNKPKYKDWLFIFGTILATYDQLSTESQGSTIDNKFNPDFDPTKVATTGKTGHMGGKKTALNVAFVQKGNSGEEKSLTVIKEVMSPIDFMTMKKKLEGVFNQSGQLSKVHSAGPQSGLMKSGVDHARAGKRDGITGWNRNQGPGKEFQDEDWKRYSGLGIFKSGGITFGMEVCLDHALERLKSSPPASGQNWIQVQLVPSAGMSIKNSSVIASQNGYVFNCDGGTPHSKVVKVKTSWKPGPVVTEEIAPSFTLSNIHPGQPFSSSYQGKANLKIYPSKPLPKNKIVT